MTEPTPADATPLAVVEPAPVTGKTPIITSGKVYDALHFIALILLPALGALYAAVSGLWGLPSTPEVLGTIVALDTLLGGLVGVSNSQYNASEAKYAGEIQTIQQEGTKIYQLVLSQDPQFLDQAKQLIFKVTKHQ